MLFSVSKFFDYIARKFGFFWKKDLTNFTALFENVIGS